MKKFAIVLFLFVLPAWAEEPPAATEESEAYRKAKVLYSEGPTKAPEVIAILTKAVEENPNDYNALGLLAITYHGTSEFEKAIETVDRAIAVDRARDQLHPNLYLLKVSALGHLDRMTEARQILVAMHAALSDQTKPFNYEELKRAVDEALVKQFAPVAAVADRAASRLNLLPAEPIYIVLDKHLVNEFIRADSDIGPFILPLALQKDWWTVIVISGSGEGEPVAVYIDKETNDVTGIVHDGAVDLNATPNGEISGRQAWSSGFVSTDDHVEVLVLRATTLDDAADPTSQPAE